MIILKKDNNSPLYIQLYNQIKNKILNGEFKSDSKLLSVRTMANTHGISINTVLTAYQQLNAEGLVKSVSKVGFIVEDINYYDFSIKSKNETKSMPLEDNLSNVLYDFQYGAIPKKYFPHKKWINISKEIYNAPSSSIFDDYISYKGMVTLRCEIQKYLKKHRNISCSNEQIIVGSGIHQMLEYLCRIIPISTIAFEEPGYDGSRKVFTNNSFKILPFSVDFDTHKLENLYNSNFSLLYVTPSHQFPYGSVLSFKKRMELIKLVNLKDAYIIEDDYDGEYRYNSLPIPSLYSMDESKRTIYLGTFSKLLLPSLRISYMVLPNYILSLYEQYYNEYQNTVSKNEQVVLSKLMESGEYEKHQRKISNIYKDKHNLIVKLLKENFPQIKIHGTNAGLHLILEFPKEVDVDNIIRKAADKKIKLYSTEPYWHDKNKIPRNILFFGYSSILLEDIVPAFNLLKEIF